MLSQIPSALRISIAAGVCAMLTIAETRAQTAEEHASHHPDQAAGYATVEMHHLPQKRLAE